MPADDSDYITILLAPDAKLLAFKENCIVLLYIGF
jgi:hypothetical protein